jgi:hypothetical protein
VLTFQQISTFQIFCLTLSSKSKASYLSSFILFSFSWSTVLKPRDKSAWKSCYSEIYSELPPAPEFSRPALLAPGPDTDTDTETTPAPPLFVIDTNFDFDKQENRCTKGRYNPKNKRSRYRYTQRQRRYAEEAQPTTSLADFQEKVRKFSLPFFLITFILGSFAHS